MLKTKTQLIDVFLKALEAYIVDMFVLLVNLGIL